MPHSNRAQTAAIPDVYQRPFQRRRIAAQPHSLSAAKPGLAFIIHAAHRPSTARRSPDRPAGPICLLHADHRQRLIIYMDPPRIARLPQALRQPIRIRLSPR